MITRIKINGFKSLLNVDLHLGPFTCIAGANAVGKSNFFDALTFLAHLCDKSLLDASTSIRSEEKGQKNSNFKNIFFKNGSEYIDLMTFEIDMLVSKEAEDDLGQIANASVTSLKYTLHLKLNADDKDNEPIEIVKEELKPINKADTIKSIFFDKKKEWITSILTNKKASGTPFISTGEGKIKLHQDGSRGRASDNTAKKMPRTLLSSVTAESPTAFLARQEMRNWMMLQFEPTALRQSNTTYEIKNAEIKANGENLAATLYRLCSEKGEDKIYQTLTNKLKELVENVNYISVDKDDKRDLLTLQVNFKDGLTLPAQSLSDGTLRFLALAIIEEDSTGSGLICLEEPENGINPRKIDEMIMLLENMVTDTDFAVDESNPLRQVIINTHSPTVVAVVQEDSLYLAKETETYLPLFNKKVKHTSFTALDGTWKTKKELVPSTNLGEINSYLNKTTLEGTSIQNNSVQKSSEKTKKTVGENVAEQMKLLLKW
ncbi:MAG: AAA family ATPase [Bacteroidia bacterium]